MSSLETATHRITVKGLPREHHGQAFAPGASVDVTSWPVSTVRAWVFEGRLVPLARTEDEITKANGLRLKEGRKATAAEVESSTITLAELNRKADALASDLQAIEAHKGREAAARAEFNATVLARNTEQARLDAARERLAELAEL